MLPISSMWVLFCRSATLQRDFIFTPSAAEVHKERRCRHGRIIQNNPSTASGHRALQGLLSQCLSCAVPSQSLWHWWSFQLLSLCPSSAPSLPSELFSENPLARAMPLSPLKVAHPGLDQSPLEAHPRALFPALPWNMPVQYTLLSTQ